MTCSHLSTKRKLTGMQDHCVKCHEPIIYTGSRWAWTFELDKTKRDKLVRAYRIDELTGAH